MKTKAMKRVTLCLLNLLHEKKEKITVMITGFCLPSELLIKLLIKCHINV